MKGICEQRVVDFSETFRRLDTDLQLVDKRWHGRI